MLNNKEYFKKYYEKNREKILFRVKSNYIKNKFIKNDNDNDKQNNNNKLSSISDVPVKVVKDKIIVSFD